MAKIMVSVACAVIMLHAVVPHHHHDCCNAMGLTFETELACHCDCDHHHDCNHSNDCDHHSHHPFNICLLQEMLSRLVISTSDDHFASAAFFKAESNQFIILALPLSQPELLVPIQPNRHVWWSSGTAPLVPAPTLGANGLRAPPVLA